MDLDGAPPTTIPVVWTLGTDRRNGIGDTGEQCSQASKFGHQAFGDDGRYGDGRRGFSVRLLPPRKEGLPPELLFDRGLDSPQLGIGDPIGHSGLTMPREPGGSAGRSRVYIGRGHPVQSLDSRAYD